MAYPFKNDRIYVLQALTPDSMMTVFVVEYCGHDTYTRGILKYSPGCPSSVRLAKKQDAAQNHELLKAVAQAVKNGDEYMGEWIRGKWKVRS